MTSGKKIIGCIGAGNMGAAILVRLAGSYDPKYLRAYDIDPSKTDTLLRDCSIGTEQSPESLAGNSAIIILAVKPDVVATVLESVKKNVSADKLIISIAAGVKISSLEQILGASTKIVRVMPNAPVLVGEGMSVLSPNSRVDNDSLLEAEQLFSKIGRVMVLPEKLLDAVTGLSGSGPAFAFTFIQALADGGVKLGIPRDKALLLAAQTVYGSAKYVLDGVEDPISLRNRVASPGGTTIEGIFTLERSGFAGIVMEAVEKAALKSLKLGER